MKNYHLNYTKPRSYYVLMDIWSTLSSNLVAKKRKQFHAVPKCGPKSCPSICISLGFGSVSTRYEMLVKSTVQQCFYTMEPHFVYFTNKIPCYQEECTACFTEKQRDLSILMPLRQSICRPNLPKTAWQNKTTRFPKPICSHSFSQTLIPLARQCKSSTQPNIQSLACDSAIELYLLQNSTCV